MAVDIFQNVKIYVVLFCRKISNVKSLNHPNFIKLFHMVQTRENTYQLEDNASDGEILEQVIEGGVFRGKSLCKVQRMFAEIVHAV